MDCTFITYSGLPELDPDDRLALNVLTGKGLRCQAAIWDDPNVDWQNAGVCVLRSTWDYHLKLNEFKDWLDELIVRTTVINHPSYLKWNLHKSYLVELESAGIPIVPTKLLRQGIADNGSVHMDIGLEIAEIESAIDEIAASGCVVQNTNRQVDPLMRQDAQPFAIVKPAVGLATSGVMKIANSNRLEARKHIEKLLQDNDVLIQPYLKSVNTYGERALVFCNGMYSHAARKTAFQALLPAGEAGETLVQATEHEIRIGKRVLEVLPELASHTVAPVYCRVDLVRDESNQPVVLEVELVEPSLFLALHPPAASALADAIETVICAGSASRTGSHN